MNCKACGHQNPDGTKFCINCGASLSYVDGSGSKKDVVNDKSGVATASMVLGIISAVFGVICCFGYVSLALSLGCGILSIIFAIVSWNSKKRNFAIAGLICGICGVILGLMQFSMVIFEDFFIEYYKEITGEDPFAGENPFA